MLVEKKFLIGPDFSGIAELILFLVLLAVVLIWVVYKLAAIIVPAVLIVLLGLGVLAVPFHQWSRATVMTRSAQRIESCLTQIRSLERQGARREEIQPLERQAREAAQALIDTAHSRFRKLEKKNTKQRLRLKAGEPLRSPTQWQDRRRQERHLGQELERLRLTYNIEPEHDRWRRLYHLHLQRDWIRWLTEHPRQARWIVGGVFVVLVTCVARWL